MVVPDVPASQTECYLSTLRPGIPKVNIAAIHSGGYAGFDPQSSKSHSAARMSYLA